MTLKELGGTVQFSSQSKTLPKGEYLLIDPCYILRDDDLWKRFCNWCFEGKKEKREGYIGLGEHLIFFWGTCWGDGEYPVSDGTTAGMAGVDAGVLSLIPMALIEEISPDPFDRSLGVPVQLRSPSIPEVSDGDLQCGNITATTSGDGDNGDDYEDDGDWDDEDEDDEDDE